MRKLFPTLAATLLASTTFLVAIPETKADTVVQDEKLVFSCEMRNDEYTTIPQMVQDEVDSKHPVILINRTVVEEYSPLLVWTETLDSDHPDGAYMPEGRCEAVSARLTNLAASMGVNDIQQLSHAGIVNHESVIFISESESEAESPVASADEVIFTLKPTNRDDADEILKLFQVGVSGGIGGPDLDVIPQPIFE
jgi:hypothetical protein